MTKGRKLVSLLIWLIPIGILAGSLWLKTTLDQATSEAASVPAIPVRVQQAARGNLAKTLKLNGYVESESMVTVLPLVSGVLQELFVDTGDAVNKDQIIGRIDAARYELQLRQAEAAYFSAKSSYDRVLQLYQAGVGSQQNLDQTKAQYDAYATQYELARLQLDYAAVKSPVDGVVLVRHLSVGAIAAPERPLVTIGDLDDLIIRARIPEKYYPIFIEQKNSLPIIITASSRRQYTGTIRTISPFVSAETKNFETIIAINDREGMLRPGMFVNMEFRLEEWENALSLPFQALSGGDTLWYMEEGTARSLKFMPDKSSDAAFILPEQYSSYNFITEGQYFVYEGAPVREVAGSSRP